VADKQYYLGPTEVLPYLDPTGQPRPAPKPPQETTVTEQQSGKTVRHDRVVVYEDNAGEHRFRRMASNGTITGDSAEGYASYSNAKRAVFTTYPDRQYVIVRDGEIVWSPGEED
jgi:uncharacterized protein YegP (UPF0339 family)